MNKDIDFEPKTVVEAYLQQEYQKITGASLDKNVERKYGIGEWQLDECEKNATSHVKDMAAHIRELQAENAKLKDDLRENALQHLATLGQAEEALDQIDKLKAERREFGMRIMEAFQETLREYDLAIPTDEAVAIVEQELNK